MFAIDGLEWVDVVGKVQVQVRVFCPPMHGTDHMRTEPTRE